MTFLTRTKPEKKSTFKEKIEKLGEAGIVYTSLGGVSWMIIGGYLLDNKERLNLVWSDFITKHFPQLWKNSTYLKLHKEFWGENYFLYTFLIPTGFILAMLGITTLINLGLAINESYRNRKHKREQR